ncbi:hypothetical protein BDF14DRAFT_1783098, partial [Spinellus fusiger]
MQDARRMGETRVSSQPETNRSYELARISPLKIDFPTQRYYAAAIFTLLQAMKIYDAWQKYYSTGLLTPGENAFMWCICDVLFMTILWFVRIPWLQFTELKTVLLSLILILMNFILFAMPVAAMTSAYIKILFGDAFTHQLGAAWARQVNVRDVIHNPNHILGRHTLRILPFGTAELNPDNEFYCLPAEPNGKEIFIPISINNTTPYSFNLEHFDFDTRKNKTRGFRGNDIRRTIDKSTDSNGVELYYVRIKIPGLYTLKSVKSKEGIDVRTKRKVAYVFTCPSARFDASTMTNVCAGDQGLISLQLTGVPPFTLEYITREGERESFFNIKNIRPEISITQTSTIHRTSATVDPSFFAPEAHGSYHWASVQTQIFPIKHTFKESASYEYQLMKVIDGFGNAVSLEGSNKLQLQVYNRPTVNFNCEDVNPMKLLIGEKYIDVPLNFQGSAPWKLTYEFAQEDTKNERFTDVSFTDTNSSLKAYAPGLYNLIQVSDVYCKGDVLIPATCLISQPPLPSIEIRETPIPSECAGNNFVGMKFFVELTGTPPFTIEYTISKIVGRKKVIIEEKTEHIDRSRYMFSYLPTSNGDYVYEFKTLGDLYYKSQSINDNAILQTVYPQPNAVFDNKLTTLDAVRTCSGETLDLDVNLSGTGPWKLTWSSLGQKYQSDVQDPRFIISLPQFQKPGVRIVSLTKIQDAKGCTIDLESHDVIIDVRRERPTAAFYRDDVYNGTVAITEGSTAILPLRLFGEGPWRVNYRNIEQPTDIMEIVTSDPNALISTKKPGLYEIVSVEDAFCKGEAIPPPYVVEMLGRPSLSIVNDSIILKQESIYEKTAVCQGANTGIDVLFEGHGSFYSAYNKYQIVPWKINHVHLGTKEINTLSSSIHVSLDTEKSGKFRYIFDKLSDQRYTQPFTPTPKLSVDYMVHPLPTVAFRKTNIDRTLCVGDSLSSYDAPQIWLELTGKAPFIVDVRVKHVSADYSQLYSVKANSLKHKLSLPDVFIQSGAYNIELISVMDSNGCQAGTPTSGSTLQV